MKRLVIATIIFSIIYSMFCLRPTKAQSPTRVECGQNIESVFTENKQVHEYQIELNPGIKLIVHGESLAGTYENLTIDLGLHAPNGYEINDLEDSLSYSHLTDTIETAPLSVAGTYSVRVRGFTDTGGSYKLFFSCVDSNGGVISSNNLVQGAVCGSIIDNEFSRDKELHRYFVNLEQGDKTQITATSMAGAYETLTLDLGLYAPNGYEINALENSLSYSHRTDTIDTDSLSVSGTYWLGVRGFTSTTGRYTLSITCVLANGTVVNPGDKAPTRLSSTANSSSDSGAQGTTTLTVQPFSGYGFPGLPPVDFAKAAVLPLVSGTPMNGAITPNGGEILGFNIEANANDVMDLSFTRLSGNLNVGLAVLSSSNQIIYQASLVTSQINNSRFTVPETGVYTIGVFRIDLMPPTNPEATAFQIQVILNP